MRRPSSRHQDAEEAGELGRVGEPFARRLRVGQVQGVEEDREEDGGGRHPHEQPRSTDEGEALRDLTQGGRPSPCDAAARVYAHGRPEDEPDEGARRREAGRPRQQEVLGAERVGERPGREPSDDGAEDPAGREDREQALRLPGVDDRARRPPQEDRLNEHREGDVHPQDRVDPPRVGEQHPALHDEDAAEDDRRQQVRASSAEPRQQPGQREHRRERHGGLEQVHEGQGVGPDPLEEQRARGALADREGRERDEHEGDEQSNQTPLAGPEAQRTPKERHR